MKNRKDDIIIFLSKELLDMKKQMHKLTLTIIKLQFDLDTTIQKVDNKDKVKN
jgi:hypothetical protein